MKCREIVKKIKSIVFRNVQCLDGKKAVLRQVNLEWWKEHINLGDSLAPVIYEWMLKREKIDPKTKIKKTVHLSTVGSLIGQGRFDAVIWGSGILDVTNARHIARDFRYRKLDVRSVRGPISKMVLECAFYECPSVYGDPAILMPLIYEGKNVAKKYDVSIIKHRSQANIHYDGIHEINIETNDYSFFIDELLASKKIISSSLHGIILAESYNVPAVFLCGGMESEILKFYDWYFSTERMNIKMANTMAEALEMKPMELPENLERMRINLIEAFPYDLWK